MLVLVFLTALCLVAVKPASSNAMLAGDSWVSKASMPSTLNSPKATELNGKIYVVGAYQGENVNNSLFEYDPLADNWTVKESLPSSRMDFAVAACNGKIYVIGGKLNPQTTNAGVALSNNEVYDPETDSWETRASVPTARYQTVAETVDGKIYVIAGRTGGADTSVGANEVYDTETDTWTTASPIPLFVAAPSSAVVDNKIYVIGGQAEFNQPMNPGLNWIYTPATDTWTQGAQHPNPEWNSASAGATTGAMAYKRVYVMGGNRDFGSLHDQNYAYNPNDNSWHAVASMPIALSYFAVAVVDDLLYVIGGSTANFDVTASVECYIPIGYGGTPEPSYVSPTPSPLPTPQNTPTPTSQVTSTPQPQDTPTPAPQSTSTPDNSGQSSTSTTQPSLLPTEIIICTVLAATIAAVTIAAIAIKKKRNKIRTLLKCGITAFIIASLAMTATNAIASAESAQYNTLGETKIFLSNVLGLDLTKYSLTDSPYLRHNETVAPLITVLNETSGVMPVPSVYFFNSDSGMIEVFSIFYNQKLAVVRIKPVGNTSAYIYANASGTDLASQASTLLTRYAGFSSQRSSADISFLATMKNVLSNVDIESSAVNITSGNMNFQASKNENVTNLQWIYADYGTIMSQKRVEIEFKNGTFASFQETWSLYKVAGPSAISAEQARKIALDAAQKYTIRTVNAEGEFVIHEKPDLSVARYDAKFFMSACYRPNDTRNSELSLEPFTLYPFWQFHFYFNETIAGDEGIYVGVLGDTGAVFYSGPIGYLGDPLTTIDTSTGASVTDNSLILLILAAITITLILIVSVLIALRSKIRRRK